MPVVGNIFVSRDRFARALGVARGELDAFCLSALRHPITPLVVDTGPVQEIVHSHPIDIGALLPVPQWFEREAAPYITAGVIVAKDRQTGRRNVSIARLRLEGGNRLMAGIAKNHHLSLLAEKAQANGHDLEIAVAIGNHAAVLLGSQMYVELGADEFDIAGGLLGCAVELVKCRTVDLEVPAHAEIILEGRLLPGELIDEGTVSEFPGFYVNYGAGLAVEISCVSHRTDAIFQAILPGYAIEHCLLGAIAIGTTLTRDLQRLIPAVQRVFVNRWRHGSASCGYRHAPAAPRRRQAGDHARDGSCQSAEACHRSRRRYRPRGSTPGGVVARPRVFEVTKI